MENYWIWISLATAFVSVEIIKKYGNKPLENAQTHLTTPIGFFNSPLILSWLYNLLNQTYKSCYKFKN